MDATYFRDKAETCLRLAKDLSWNNPARGELMELAEEFQRQAEELKATTQQRPARWRGLLLCVQNAAVGSAQRATLRRKIFQYFQKTRPEPHPAFARYFSLERGGTRMRTLAILAATLGLIGTIAVGTAAPAAADWYGRHHHRYYNYYGGGGTWNGCRPGWTVQGGVCKPYQGPVGPGWGWYR
jgi:hypothetical protein